jgi:uncharacterized damage-inducible protein DinB
MSVVLPQVLEPLSLIFKLNNGLVSRGLEGLSDDDVWRTPPAGGNPIGWILGHLTESRLLILNLLGRPMAAPWEGRRFARGAARLDPNDYPERPQIQAAWNATHAQMRDGFAEATAERLNAAARLELPGVNTVADQIAFGAMHESYHVGQIAYARRQLGHSGIAG